jgi:hypothetical protein
LKITPAQVEEIRRRYIAREPVEAICDAIGIKPVTLWRYATRLGIVRPRTRLTVNPHAFDVLNPGACYWAGFLIADGCLLDTSPGASIVSLKLQWRDAAHVERFAKFVQSDAPIAKVTATDRDYAFIRVRATGHLRNRLDELGITPRKSLTAAACSELCKSTDFWRGVIDGDGSIGKRIRPNGTHAAVIRLFSASLEFSRQYAAFVRSRLGVDCSMHTIEKFGRNPKHSMGLTGENAVNMLRLLYTSDGEALERKQSDAKFLMCPENATVSTLRRLRHPDRPVKPDWTNHGDRKRYAREYHHFVKSL